MFLLRLLTYFVPFATNVLTGGFLFISTLRFAQAGCSGKVVGMAMTAWAVAYCLVTLPVGKFSGVTNALRFIVCGGILLIVSAGGFIIFDALYMQFIWLVTAGIGAALFCTPFQIFAKSVESRSQKSSAAAVASGMYTLTWSLGFTFGQLAFARFSIRTGYLVTLFLAAAATASALLTAKLCEKQPEIPAENNTNTAEKAPFTGQTFFKLAVMGWLIGGLGVVTICLFRVMIPKCGAAFNISRQHIACIISLSTLVQGLTALLLCRSKTWMYRRIPAIFMAAGGIIPLVLFAFISAVPLFYLAAGLYGIFSGCFYFSLVFHSLSHPEKNSFFVAGNEVIVGIVSMVAPFFGGWLADFTGFNGSPFIFAAAVCLLILAVQLIILNPAKLERVCTEQNYSRDLKKIS